jgi:NAD(P) transhydrogenase subunit alpha
MIIGALRETAPGEARVALTPASARDLGKLGHVAVVEAGAGVASGFSDDAYAAAGVEVLPSAAAVTERADVLVKVRPPEPGEVAFRDGQALVSFVYPAQNAALLDEARAAGVTLIAMDAVPRISRAQKMDALSSMANIAGYRAVIEAANNFGRFLTAR